MGNSDYELLLPVYKKGDDFAEYVEEGNSPQEALLRMAEQYEEAAEICRQAAAAMANVKGVVEVFAGSNTICISAPTGSLDALVVEDIVRPYQGEEDDFYRDETLPDGVSPEYLNATAGAWYIDQEGKPHFSKEGLIILPARPYASPAELRDAEDLLWETISGPGKINFGVRLTDSKGHVGLLIFLEEEEV